VKRVLSLFLGLLLLCSCAPQPEIIDLGPMQPVPGELRRRAEEPVSVTKEYPGDLRLTVTSARTVYDLEKMDPDAPLAIEATLEYLGEEESVLLEHLGSPIAPIIGPVGGKPVFEWETELVEYYDEITKERPLALHKSFKLEYEYTDGFRAGLYQVQVYVNFTVDPKGAKTEVHEILDFCIGME